MEIGSKLAITKLKKIEPPNGEPFYLATATEKVYNSKNPINKWESAFYPEVYIFNSKIELEPAEFTLNNNEKDKYSFANIANPEKSVIRVINFKYENHTVWWGKQQKKDDYNKPIIKPVFYLLEIEPNSSKWVSEERKSKQLQTKIDALMKMFEKKEQKYKDQISDLKAEIKALTRKNERTKQVIEKHKNKIEETKNQLKEAHYETMVYKRQNTINSNTLERTQQKLNETSENLKQIKKMKKQEVIEKANEFIDNNFDFGDI